MKPAELSAMLRRSKKRGRKTIHVTTLWKPFVPGWTEFYLALLKESRFSLFGIKHSSRQRSSRCIAERQWLITSTKHREALCAANQLGLNTPESLVNTTWSYTILYFGKRARRTNDHTLRQYGENRILNDLIRSKIQNKLYWDKALQECKSIGN